MRRAAALRRFLHVGTAYICGAPAPALVREDDFPRSGVRHLVEYTASKAECEMLLENTAPELPLVVARPSSVVGHTRLGCGPSARLLWSFRSPAVRGPPPFPPPPPPRHRPGGLRGAGPGGAAVPARVAAPPLPYLCGRRVGRALARRVGRLRRGRLRPG